MVVGRYTYFVCELIVPQYGGRGSFLYGIDGIENILYWMIVVDQKKCMC